MAFMTFVTCTVFCVCCRCFLKFLCKTMLSTTGEAYTEVLLTQLQYDIWQLSNVSHVFRGINSSNDSPVTAYPYVHP